MSVSTTSSSSGRRDSPYFSDAAPSCQSSCFSPPFPHEKTPQRSLKDPNTSSLATNYPCLWLGCQASGFPNEEALYHHVAQVHVATGKQVCMWQIDPEAVTSARHSAKKPCKSEPTESIPRGPFGRACSTFARSKGHFYDHVIVHFSSSLKPLVCQVNFNCIHG